MRTLIFILCLLVQSPVWAQPPIDDVRAAFRDGDYLIARTMGHALGTADSLTEACRASLVLGGFMETGDTAVRSLHQALDDCSKANSLDQRHANARISYAIAVGLEGKRLKKIGYAKASRRLLEEVIVVWPDYALTHAALAGWHSEVHEAGLLARLFLGAKRHVAAAHFRKALMLAPKDVGIHFEYVKFLARGDKAERREALAACDVMLALKPATAFEGFLQEKTRDIRAALADDDKKTLKLALEAATPFAHIRDWRAIDAYPLDLDDP